MHVGLIVAKFVVVVLGIGIAVQSYRAYARYDSKPMFYLALGFTVISIGAVIEGVLYEVGQFSIFDAGMIQATVVACGMCLILYSIHYQTQ